MSPAQDWLFDASLEIAARVDEKGTELRGVEISAIIEKHCPFKRDLVYSAIGDTQEQQIGRIDHLMRVSNLVHGYAAQASVFGLSTTLRGIETPRTYRQMLEGILGELMFALDQMYRWGDISNHRVVEAQMEVKRTLQPRKVQP